MIVEMREGKKIESGLCANEKKVPNAVAMVGYECLLLSSSLPFVCSFLS